MLCDAWEGTPIAFKSLKMEKNWERSAKVFGGRQVIGDGLVYTSMKNTTRYRNQTRWTSVLWKAITPSNRAGMVELGLPWKGL
jgi:hypothetical protein